jgi:hypothetical protein
MRVFVALTLLASLLGACSAPGGPYPSLQPRAAEMIDPRVPVERPVNDRPVSARLATELAQLVAQANGGSRAFDRAADQAEAAAAHAGAASSESWMAAQQALSAAVAARGPVVTALADIDALGAAALRTQSGIAPNDLEAIQNAAAEVGVIDRRQAARIDSIQRRLGL